MDALFLIQKATRLIRQCSQASIFVAPLIVLGVAHAASVTILPTSNGACADYTSSYGSGGTCSATASQLPAFNGLEGVDLSLNGSATDATTNGSGELLLRSSGTLSGPLAAGTVIPVDYSFDLSGEPSSWTLDIQIQEFGGNFEEVNYYAYGAGGGRFSGVGALTVSSAIASGESVEIASSLSYQQGNTNEVFSSFSADVNPSSLATPEPAPATLFAAGLSFLGWLRFRRNRRGC
jgi:hypothetical protein